MDINEPKRGDVLVFRYPEDPSIDYIKRVVGIPGDVITYHNKRLTINGEAIKTEYEERLQIYRIGFWIYLFRSAFLNI
ncbi:MAG: signal peptidase I [Nitrosomonas sp.]